MMESIFEATCTEANASEHKDFSALELSDFQLALVGGGIGETVL